MHQDMNSAQETLHDILFVKELVSPKRVAYRLHRHSTYLSDICRRERIDFVAVFNEILKEADEIGKHDPHKTCAIAMPILRIMLGGTRWTPVLLLAENPQLTYDKLCAQTGMLLQELGLALQSLASIEADGAVNEQDDKHIAEFCAKAGQLTERLTMLIGEVQRRRMAQVEK